ncbi:MAG: NAD-dependent epimerase/dehydratase family protein [Deltaproteobacteria bacterium]
MKAFVTGASGFVGSAVVRKLIEEGHEVRALVRPSSNRRNVTGLPIEIVTGDIRERGSFGRALRGCNALFHVAADYRLWIPKPEEMYRTNVQGTRNVMMAAARAGVEHIVYTSSVATLGHTRDGSPADETTPATLADMIGHYKRSKFLAESEVRYLAAEIGLPVVIVNPSTPIGPRDARVTPTGQMILQAASGRMPAYVDTGLNLVHVDDVATGHLLACERGRCGERYILGACNMTLKEILTALCTLTGDPKPRFRLPHHLILPVAYVVEALTRLTGGSEPLLTVDGVRLARKKMFFSEAKAERELGYSTRPVIQALKDALEWFMENGYLLR